MKLNLPLLFVIICFQSFAVLGQTTVKGKIVEIPAKQALPFAVVQAYALPDTVMKQGAVSNESGFFTLKLQPGSYILSTSMLGYSGKPRVIEVPDQTSFQIRPLAMKATANELDVVEIQAEQTFLQSSIDRKSFSVDQIVGFEASTALEAMQQIPSLQIDIDGTISLRGNENVTILVDGQPSVLSKEEMEQYLQALPAGSVERIEVITNPSAKYDPDGMTGMLNIVMKRQKQSSNYGSVTLGGNTIGGYNGSILYNYSKNKFSWMTNASLVHRKNERDGTTNRSEYRTQDTLYLEQKSTSINYRNGLSWNNQFSYQFNEQNSFNVNAQLSSRERGDNETTYSRTYSSNNGFDSTGTRYTDELSDRLSYDITGRWQSTLKNKGKLELTGKYGENNGGEIELYNNYSGYYDEPASLPINERNDKDQKSSFVLGQADYSQKLNDLWSMESGAKYQVRDSWNKNTYEVYEDADWVEDPNRSQEATILEGFGAAYGLGAYQGEKIQFQGGLRAEWAYTDVILPDTTGDWRNEYFSLFPTAHLSLWQSEESQWKLSYSRRLNRPSGRQLNPLANFDDPLNIRQGNPYLLPEYINSYELEYLRYWNRNFASAAVYVKDVRNQISRIRTVEDGVSVTTYENIGQNLQAGLDMNLRYNIAKWWNVTWNANAYYLTIQDDNQSELQNDGFQWFTKLTSDFPVSKSTTLQIASQYRSRRVYAQGEIKPNYRLNLGARVRLFDNKGTLSATYNDIFNTYNFNFITNDVDFDQEATRQWLTSYLQLSFSYSFGATQNQNRKGSNHRGSGGGDGFEMD